VRTALAYFAETTFATPGFYEQDCDNELAVRLPNVEAALARVTAREAALFEPGRWAYAEYTVLRNERQALISNALRGLRGHQYELVLPLTLESGARRRGIRPAERSDTGARPGVRRAHGCAHLNSTTAPSPLRAKAVRSSALALSARLCLSEMPIRPAKFSALPASSTLLTPASATLRTGGHRVYVVRKVRRTNPSMTEAMAAYSIVDGVIRRAPDLHTLIESRLARAAFHLKEAVGAAEALHRARMDRMVRLGRGTERRGDGDEDAAAGENAIEGLCELGVGGEGGADATAYEADATLRKRARADDR
jgi:hypothetical protein